MVVYVVDNVGVNVLGGWETEGRGGRDEEGAQKRRISWSQIVKQRTGEEKKKRVFYNKPALISDQYQRSRCEFQFGSLIR